LSNIIKKRDICAPVQFGNLRRHPNAECWCNARRVLSSAVQAVLVLEKQDVNFPSGLAPYSIVLDNTRGADVSTMRLPKGV